MEFILPLKIKGISQDLNLPIILFDQNCTKVQIELLTLQEKEKSLDKLLLQR